MNRNKQLALTFTVLMIVFALYSEYQRTSAPAEPAPQSMNR